MKHLIILLAFSFVVFSCGKKNTAKTKVNAAFISDQDFSETVLADDGLVVVDFWASWCGPCKSMDPVIESFATEYSDVKFVKIDIDRHQQVKERYSVFAIPTLLFIKDGKEISRQVGLTTEGTVRNKIERWR